MYGMTVGTATVTSLHIRHFKTPAFDPEGTAEVIKAIIRGFGTPFRRGGR